MYVRDEIAVLKASRVVAVVGATNEQNRPGYRAPQFLQQHGFRIVPVNPNEREILGEKAYPSLSAVDLPFDIVYILRRAEAVPPIVDEALSKSARVIWLAEGVKSEAARGKAEAAGVDYLEDRCIHCAVRDNLAALGLAKA